MIIISNISFVVPSFMETIQRSRFPPRKSRINIRHWSCTCSSISRYFFMYFSFPFPLKWMPDPKKYHWGREKCIFNHTPYSKYLWMLIKNCDSSLFTKSGTGVVMENFHEHYLAMAAMGKMIRAKWLKEGGRESQHGRYCFCRSTL